MPKKVILASGLDKNNGSVRTLTDWAHGEKHGFRPGFSFSSEKTREDGVYVFSIVPTEATVVPCFLIELDGLYKCVVSFLQPGRSLTVSGLKHRNGKDKPRIFVIFDGGEIKTIEEEPTEIFQPVQSLQRAEEIIPQHTNGPVQDSVPQQTDGFIPRGMDKFPDHIPKFVRDLINSVRSGNKKIERAV